jgi:cytochrome c553
MTIALNNRILAVLAAVATMTAADAPAQNRTSDLAATCAACHGAKGEGNAQSNFPRMAGQSQLYLARQLASYANGSRNNPVMSPIAKQLSQQQITELSTYYESLVAPASKSSTAAPAISNLQKRGKTLATIGDERAGVQACANCHGPNGIGEPPFYPYLAGQYDGYLKSALSEWKSGARTTDPSRQMNTIAKRLSESDIAALSAYFSAQPVAPPAAQLLNQPVRASRTTAVSNTKEQAGRAPLNSVSSEQGAPRSGGSEGPGGGGAASGTTPPGGEKSYR